MENKEDFNSLDKENSELKEKVENKLEELKELLEMDFFQLGDAYQIEVFYLDSFGTKWDEAKQGEKDGFLRELGSHLDVDLLNFSPKDIIREYDESGVKGASSEGGAKVKVLGTNIPELEVHVKDFKNPELGRLYDLVRKEVNK